MMINMGFYDRRHSHHLAIAMAGAISLVFGLAGPALSTTSNSTEILGTVKNALPRIPVPKILPYPACQVRSAIVVDAGPVDASCLVTEKGCPGLKKDLEKISLGNISEPLGKLTLPREQIAKLLGPLAARLVLPQRVQVRRRGDILPGQDVSSRIAAICMEQAGLPDSFALSIDTTRVPGNIVLPGPMQSFDVEPMSSNNYGLRLFSLTVDCKGGQVHQIVQVEVARKVHAARLKRLAKPGELLTAGDISEEVVLQRNDQTLPLLRFEEALGKRLTTYKSPGTYLRGGDISISDGQTQTGVGNPVLPVGSAEDAPSWRRRPTSPIVGVGTASSAKGDWVIRPGEKVEFFVKSGGLSLKVPAKALEGGGVGESIKLLNLQNNRQITGIVTAEGKVEYGVN